MGGAADSRIGKPIEQFVNDGLRFDIFPHMAKEAPAFQPGRVLQHFRSVSVVATAVDPGSRWRSVQPA